MASATGHVDSRLVLIAVAPARGEAGHGDGVGL